MIENLVTPLMNNINVIREAAFEFNAKDARNFNVFVSFRKDGCFAEVVEHPIGMGVIVAFKAQVFSHHVIFTVGESDIQVENDAKFYYVPFLTRVKDVASALLSGKKIAGVYPKERKPEANELRLLLDATQIAIDIKDKKISALEAKLKDAEDRCLYVYKHYRNAMQVKRDLLLKVEAMHGVAVKDVANYSTIPFDEMKGDEVI